MSDALERLGPLEAGRSCDFLCLHGYPIYADFAEGPTDERLLPFLASITRWLGGRDVLFEAFGALREAGCSGAMLRCYGDYAEGLWGEPPLDVATWERWFGLWRADGTAKAAVGEVGAFAGRARVAAADVGWIDIEREEFAARPGEQLRRLYGRFCEWGERAR